MIDAGSRRGIGLALLAAVTLDGVPENLALGVSLVETASLSLLDGPANDVAGVSLQVEARTHT